MSFLDTVIDEINTIDKSTKIKKGSISSFSSSMARRVRDDYWDRPKVAQQPLLLKFCKDCRALLVPEGAKRNITPSYLKKGYYLCNPCAATKVRKRYHLNSAVISLQKQIRRRKTKLAKLLGVISVPSS
jgi:hypothetical protein